jgi:anthranilate synthase/aminodeoxychorismate synthase-like glutamine amidotransferase
MPSSPRRQVLLVDHDDSFTYNLVHSIAAAGANVVVRPASTVGNVSEFDALVLGPGHGRPEESAKLLGNLARSHPGLAVLGVCLGHQAIATWAGAVVERSTSPVHGERVAIFHDGNGIFCGIPAPLFCARYNSLTVRSEQLPIGLEVSARSAEGEVMAIRHRTLPIQGIQFHPESVLSDFGCQILRNWLEDM